MPTHKIDPNEMLSKIEDGITDWAVWEGPMGVVSRGVQIAQKVYDVGDNELLRITVTVAMKTPKDTV